MISAVNKRTELVELTSKAQLEEESATTGHCIGTNSAYATALERGETRFFSIRINQSKQSPPVHYSVEYDVKTRTIKQIKTNGNRMVSPQSDDLADVIGAIGRLTEQLQAEDSSENENGLIRIEDLPSLSPNQALLKNGSVVELKTLSKAELANVLKLVILLDDTSKQTDFKLSLSELAAHPQCGLTYRGSDNTVVAEVFKDVNYIGGDAYFSSLTSAEGLSALERIGGDAGFLNLKSAEGLSALESIGYIIGSPCKAELTKLLAAKKVDLRKIK